MYHFTDGGLKDVWLSNGYVEKDTPYGKSVAFNDLEGLTKAICDALAKKPGKLTGAEFRYLRTALLMSQKSLGKMLGCSEQAVAKWEKTGKVPKAEDYLIRVIYTQSCEGNGQLGAAVAMLNTMDRISHTKFILSEKNDTWQSKVEVTPELEAAA